MTPSLLVSIHDVAPETLGMVRNILDRLEKLSVTAVTLLVVPGRTWSTGDILRLDSYRSAGIDLAGHGWFHRCTPQTPFHRLHGLFLSRNVAEHLALNSQQIVTLIRRCHSWFVDHDLGSPALYVPPAWAMGAISRSTLQRLPFRFYETLSGVYDARQDKFHPIPVVGFEADTPLRKWFLRFYNSLNTNQSSLTRRPLRVAIHPHDFRLQLAKDLQTLLSAHTVSLPYSKIS